MTNDQSQIPALKRVAAYYGSLEAYKAIPDWSHFDVSHNSETPVLLDHGYDETKDVDTLTDAELNKAAAFRGGKYLGDDTWQCAQGHTFKASRRLILLGGHWCPDCFPFPYDLSSPHLSSPHLSSPHLSSPHLSSPIPWHWDRVARTNPFFAQLWAPLHDPSEDNVYGPEIFDGWEK